MKDPLPDDFQMSPSPPQTGIPRSGQTVSNTATRTMVLMKANEVAGFVGKKNGKKAMHPLPRDGSSLLADQLDALHSESSPARDGKMLTTGLNGGGDATRGCGSGLSQDKENDAGGRAQTFLTSVPGAQMDAAPESHAPRPGSARPRRDSRIGMSGNSEISGQGWKQQELAVEAAARDPTNGERTRRGGSSSQIVEVGIGQEGDQTRMQVHVVDHDGPGDGREVQEEEEEEEDEDEKEDEDEEGEAIAADEAVLQELTVMMEDLSSSVGIRTAQRLMRRAVARLDNMPGAAEASELGGDLQLLRMGPTLGDIAEEDAREEARELERLLEEEEEMHRITREARDALNKEVAKLRDELSRASASRESEGGKARGGDTSHARDEPAAILAAPARTMSSGGVLLEVEKDKQKILQLEESRELADGKLEGRERDRKAMERRMCAAEGREREAKEAKECLEGELEAMKGLLQEARLKQNAAQEEARRAIAAEKVLRRNMACGKGGLGEEYRRLARRVEELEGDRRRGEAAKGSTGDSSGAGAGSGGGACGGDVPCSAREELEAVIDDLRRERDEYERRTEMERHDLEVRLREAEASLKKKGAKNKDTGASVESAYRRTAANRKIHEASNDVAALKRRNLELVTSNHALDEARSVAENAARDAMSRAHILEEKLGLLQEVAKIDMAKEAHTESEVDRLLPTPRAHSLTPRAPASSRPSSRPSSAVGDGRSERDGVGGGQGVSARPQAGGWGGGLMKMMRGHASDRCSHAANGEAAAVAGTVGREEEIVQLRERLLELEERISVEEAARVSAQETLVLIACQLSDKDEELDALRSGSGKGV